MFVEASIEVLRLTATKSLHPVLIQVPMAIKRMGGVNFYTETVENQLLRHRGIWGEMPAFMEIAES